MELGCGVFFCRSSDKSKEYWVSLPEQSRRILPREILERLKVSYDALNKKERQIFLDIGRFFIGQSRRTAIAVWDDAQACDLSFGRLRAIPLLLTAPRLCWLRRFVIPRKFLGVETPPPVAGMTVCGTKGKIILRGNEDPMLLECKLGEIGFSDAKAVRSVRRRPVRNRQVSEEHCSEVGAITERRQRRDDSSSFSSNPRLGPPPTFALTSEGNDHYYRHIHPFADLASIFIWSASVLVLGSYQLFLANLPLIHRFADLASRFNLGALVFVLGSYELLLSNPLFWMCWCILVTKTVICNSIQPYWEWIESEGIRDDHGRAGAIIFKLGMSIALIALLKCSQDITHRENTILLILSASIFLFEGLTPLLRRNASGTITGGQKCKALIFFSPSALNAMIAITGPIILAGDLGHLMSDEAFWGFLFILLVDVFAEFVPGIVSRRRSPFVMSEDLPKIHHVVVILRVIVEGCLCCWMGKVINGDSYLPSDLGMDDCNKLCRERSKQLLITMVALGGLQALRTFITSLCCVLGHRHVPTIPLFVRSHIASA